MNYRLSSGLMVIASLVPLTACRTATDEQSKADVAQQKADTTIYESNADRNERNRKAQAEADVEIAEARAAFIKMRDEYHNSSTKALADLDLDIANLEAKQKTATGQDKLDLDASLTNIRAARMRYTKAHSYIEETSASNFDQAKLELDAQWVLLRDLVDKS